MAARHTGYEDEKHSPNAQVVHLWERQKKTKLSPYVAGWDRGSPWEEQKRDFWLSPTSERSIQKRGQVWGTEHLTLRLC